MKQYLIELKDKLHIVTAELRSARTGKELRLLKPDGEDEYFLEREDCSDYWEWLKREKSIVSEDEVDICFLFPAGETGEAFRKAAQSLNARLLPETRWTKSEIEQYLHKTDRRLRGTVPAADSAFSVLMLAGGTKLYAAGFNGQGLKQPEEIPAAPAFAGSCDRSPAHAAGAAVPKASAKHRPKAFPAAAADLSAPRTPVPAADRQSPDGAGALPPEADVALPPATPDEIQAGINYVIRNHCRTTDTGD